MPYPADEAGRTSGSTGNRSTVPPRRTGQRELALFNRGFSGLYVSRKFARYSIENSRMRHCHDVKSYVGIASNTFFELECFDRVSFLGPTIRHRWIRRCSAREYPRVQYVNILDS